MSGYRLLYRLPRIMDRGAAYSMHGSLLPRSLCTKLKR